MRPQTAHIGPFGGASDARHVSQIGTRLAVSSRPSQSRQGAGNRIETMASRACRRNPGGREFEREPTLRKGYSSAEIFTRKTNTDIKPRQRRFLDGKP